MAEQADGQQSQLGLWPLLPLFAQPEGFQMESQACLSGLQRVGAEPQNQTSQTFNSREARSFNSATGNQSGLVNGLYA